MSEQLASEFAAARREMLEDQLRHRGISNQLVLGAMARVPRELFVLDEVRDLAYADCALPIRAGQTISQPFTVAFMAELLQLTGREHVLEIGTGSGYAAAVLSLIAQHVDTVERLTILAADATERLERLGYTNVSVHEGDGTLGWPAAAPYDAISVTAGGTTMPLPLFEQLKEGGRLVIPLQSDGRGQQMWRFTRRQGQPEAECLGSFSFVPLIGIHGWDAKD
ncbi:MAG: protein-L-isoaspartate(D-aspartate) O-methyltransferase [Planctomycetales bacterium]|nr:protein-L-isoaspartate(D-aspartate) O-methyltransferase [Planctomycetales bacterium]MCA9170460.1 protein-L-isoaspartate(D-aspartate) O-methyltransferase [Planctomycetales bacterium]